MLLLLLEVLLVAVIVPMVLVPLDMLPGPAAAGPKDMGAMGVAGAEAEVVMVVAVEVVEQPAAGERS